MKPNEEANPDSIDNINKANDKLHSSDLGEIKDFDNLAYNKDSNTFEYDVKGEETDYDHPLPYDTGGANGTDFNSDYDEANEFIGDEYARTPVEDPALNDLGMRVDDGDIVELDPEDELLARTPEDDRPDLDEEGYPINDRPPLPL
jgi:hypothetical protein